MLRLMLCIVVVALLITAAHHFENFTPPNILPAAINTQTDARAAYDKEIKGKQIAAMKDTRIGTGDVPYDRVITAEKLYFLDDPMFSDVVYYMNDDLDYYKQRTGLEKCLDSRCGNCVEFGMTGNAFCYPPRQYAPRDYSKK